MADPRPWTVLAHGPLTSLTPNLRTVEGVLPRGHVPRRMTVARRADGRLVFFNAIPLGAGEMAELEAWGAPAFLVAPTPMHRLDLHAYATRYLGLQILCPAGCRAQVAKVVTVHGDLRDFPPDSQVSVEDARGTGQREAILRVRSGETQSLVFADLIMNLTQVAGLDGLFFKLLGSIGGPRVTRLALLALVKDRRAVRGQLEELAALPGLQRLIPSHGAVVETNAAEVLRQVAARLG